VGETLGALFAAERAELAADPAVRGALERIAADEARHAALAWRTVRWAIEHGGADVADAVTQAFLQELHRLERPSPWVTTRDAAARRMHGVLTEAEMANLGRHAARAILAPCAAALLGEPPTSHPQPTLEV
jgi:hypothetical protein